MTSSAVMAMDGVSFTYVRPLAFFGRRGTSGGIRNVSFSAEKGDKIALIGRNGAGKTTLLKCLAGVFSPSTGVVSMHGRVGALFGRGVGINQLLTGKQNIYVRGLMLGLSDSQLSEKFIEIEDFIEVGKFMNLPVSSYSQGMRARLAFGMLMLVNADVLLIDEALGAGDRFFIRKTRGYVEQLLSNSKGLMFASHSEHLLRRFCNKGLVMDSGKMVFYGAYEDANEFYKKSK